MKKHNLFVHIIKCHQVRVETAEDSTSTNMYINTNSNNQHNIGGGNKEGKGSTGHITVNKLKVISVNARSLLTESVIRAGCDR